MINNREHENHKHVNINNIKQCFLVMFIKLIKLVYKQTSPTKVGRREVKAKFLEHI